MKNIKLSYGITLINKKFKKNQYYHYLKTFNHVLVVPKIKNKFILVSQKRIPINKINYELPSGNIEWNETPVRCANKELFEETGYKSTKRIKKIIEFHPDPGRINSKMTVFYTKSLKKIANPENGIKIHKLTIKQIFRLIKDRKFNNASHIAAFLYFINNITQS